MNSSLDNKVKWQARKKKFGIPDAVCKFSMGDKLESFAKLAESVKAGDFAAQGAAWNTIIPTLTAYNAALAAMKPAKFTCKPAEQVANHKKTKDEVAEWLSFAKDQKQRAEAFQKPMVMLTKGYATVFAKFKTLNKNDVGELKAFYRTELRNDLGQYVKLAVKLPLGAGVLHDLNRYEEMTKGIEQTLNGAGDLAKAHLDMAKALAVLHQHMN